MGLSLSLSIPMASPSVENNRNGLLKEEKNLGAWPRWLLHVPSMTSCEWKPGNVYGAVASLAYNALSSTWGR